jgi:hypothetical protein
LDLSRIFEDSFQDGKIESWSKPTIIWVAGKRAEQLQTIRSMQSVCEGGEGMERKKESDDCRHDVSHTLAVFNTYIVVPGTEVLSLAISHAASRMISLES